MQIISAKPNLKIEKDFIHQEVNIMKKVIALLLAVVTIFALVVPASAASRFPDVTGHWAESYIENWADKGVISGYSDGTFRPDQEITRAEVAKVLALAYEMKIYGDVTDFTDVSEDDWFYTYAQLCSSNGVVNGYPDGTFQPNASITRSEAVKMVCLAAGLTEKDSGIEEVGFKDESSVPQWSLGYWNALYHVGVIDGYSETNTLRPLRNITRAEFIKILCKAFSEVKIYEFTVTIFDNLGNTVTDSVSYLTGDCRVIETLVPMLIANRSTFAELFPSVEMRKLLDEGIAIAQAGYADGWTEASLAKWQNYINTNFADVAGDPPAIAYISNVLSTINTMKMDVPYELRDFHDTQEGRENITYTVLITASVMD